MAASDSLFRIVTLDRGMTQVCLVGEVDASNADELRQSLADLVRQGNTRLLIDLTDVDFIDSTGLGVLLHTVKELRAQRGSLTVACPNPTIRELFELVGHNLLFPVDETVDQALAHLRPRRRFARRRQTGAGAENAPPAA
jgi:anti-sigma B factor antagonist